MKLFYFYTITNDLSLRDCVNLLKLNKSTTSKISFIKDNQIIKCKHQGFDMTFDGSDINNPRSIYDIDKWCKSDRSKLYEEE